MNTTNLSPNPNRCEWIEPYPLESMVRCEHTQEQGYQYCEAHLERMGQKGTAYRKRTKDIARAARVQELGSLFNDVVAELEDAGEIEL
jgi:hypothetical protein